MAARITERDEAKALAIYDRLREAHKSIKMIWVEHPDLVDTAVSEAMMWESAIDAVDNTLYLAEGFFAGVGKP